jgi:hypothetical protein
VRETCQRERAEKLPVEKLKTFQGNIKTHSQFVRESICIY